MVATSNTKLFKLKLKLVKIKKNKKLTFSFTLATYQGLTSYIGWGATVLDTVGLALLYRHRRFYWIRVFCRNWLYILAFWGLKKPCSNTARWFVTTPDHDSFIYNPPSETWSLHLACLEPMFIFILGILCLLIKWLNRCCWTAFWNTHFSLLSFKQVLALYQGRRDGRQNPEIAFDFPAASVARMYNLSGPLRVCRRDNRKEDLRSRYKCLGSSRTGGGRKRNVSEREGPLARASSVWDVVLLTVLWGQQGLWGRKCLGFGTGGETSQI